MQVTCPRCGYTWNYKGKRVRPVCPNCGYTFRVTTSPQQEVVAKKDLGKGVFLFSLPLNEIDKVKQKELWEKAGAKVIEASKDDRVVIVDIPDDKAEEVLQRFQQLLEAELNKMKKI